MIPYDVNPEKKTCSWFVIVLGKDVIVLWLIVEGIAPVTGLV